MKKVLISFVFFACVMQVMAQDKGDTLVVKTLTFDDIVKRKATFDFPDEGETYRKVLMYKTLKCDPRTTRDNYPCGEWDYLTYIYLWDSTGVYDSNLVQQSNFLVENQALTSFDFTSKPVFDLWESKHKQNFILDTINISKSAIGKAENLVPTLFSDGKNGQVFYDYSSAELTQTGLTKGEIEAIELNIESNGTTEPVLLEIWIDSTSTVSQSFDNKGVLAYKYPSILSETGKQVFAFNETFSWNGVSPLRFTFTYETSQSEAGLFTLGENKANDTLGWYAPEDGYFDFENIDYIEVPNEAFDDVENEISICFWHFGNESKQPSNNSIIEGVDSEGNRILNIHLPWGNGTIYWDAGYSEGRYNRIVYTPKEEDYKGKWNFWAFTKNSTSGEMKIFLNGKRVMYASNLKRTMKGVSHFKLGSGINGYFYNGYIDDFSIWNKELNIKDLSEFMFNKISDKHIKYPNLQVYYNFNQANINSLVYDQSNNNFNAQLYGKPFLRTMRGSELFKGFEPITYKPQLTLMQGAFQLQEDSAKWLYKKAVASKKLEIFNEDENPTEADSTYEIFEASKYSYHFDENGNKLDSFWINAERGITQKMFSYYVVFEVITKYELGRFITPYGIGLDLGPDGFTWVYDVTDYVHLLKGRKTIEAGNTQELINLDFHYIKGVPSREVLAVDEIWPHRSYSYRDLSNNSALSPKTMTLLPDAKTFKVVTRFTGHGHNSNDNSFPHCCEWKDNEHSLLVNGNKVADWHIWRDDCDVNPVFPQGGTWNGAREGWCPGDLVPDFNYEITEFVKGSEVEIDYDITPVPADNQGMGNGNYVVSMQLIQYGEPNFATDAEILEVKRPSNFGYYKRINPACESPLITLKNNGKAPISSVIFSYWVSGNSGKLTYEWKGNLAFDEKQDILLPVEKSHFWLGDEKQQFTVEIMKVNSVDDDYEANNIFTTHFELPEILQNKFSYYLRTNNNPEENKIVINKPNGEIVYQKEGFQANTVYEEAINLPNGCYILELEDEGYGLSYWAWPEQGNGSFSIKDADGKVVKVFEPDFGKSIYYPFAVGSISNVKAIAFSQNEMKLFPNPAQNELHISYKLKELENARLSLINIHGQVVLKEDIKATQMYDHTWKINHLPSGVYAVKLHTKTSVNTQLLIIE